MTKEQILKIFQDKIGGDTPEVYTSPGRINLIGEHTDYNGSFVFPGAVDKGMIAAIRLNGTDKIKAYAADLDEWSEFGLNEEDLPKEGWAKFIFGVCREIIKRGGKVEGFDTAFAGVPLGAAYYRRHKKQENRIKGNERLVFTALQRQARRACAPEYRKPRLYNLFTANKTAENSPRQTRRVHRTFISKLHFYPARQQYG